MESKLPELLRCSEKICRKDRYRHKWSGFPAVLCDLLYRMVIFMNQQLKNRRFVSVLLAALLVVTMFVSMAPPVIAANRRFITELRIETGEEAVSKLEAEGWSVTMVGLNVTSDPAAQVYLAYKTNTGSAITNVIVSPDVGDSFTDKNGIVYKCVSHVDVDNGIGGGAGCIYATGDERAGTPLVGIDVLRGNNESGEVLYPITNDGAEIVRTPNGAPADLEKGSSTDVIYLAQIHDGMVRPYISEIGIITDTDKWNAVYTACERGYNYYIDGDIDNSPDTYTIIGYERTANPEEAVTNITAVSARTVQSLEDEQIIDKPTGQEGHVTAVAISISGVEYVRISSKPVSAGESYYIYRTKDSKAGNPISMLYAETLEQPQNFLFSTWANAYFFSQGVTTAYTYSMNEDLYMTLWDDQTVCSKLPVRLIDSFALHDVTAKQSEMIAEDSDTSNQGSATADRNLTSNGKPESTPETTSNIKPESTPETPPEETSGVDRFVNITMLTPRDGLPDTAASLTGLRNNPSLPYVERTQRSDRVNKFQASVFGNNGFLVLIPLGVLIVVGAAFAIYKKKSVKKVSVTPEKTNKPNKPNKAKKSKKPR